MNASSPPTIVAQLTPPGRGAVAVVVVAGPQAIECVAAEFHSATGRNLHKVPVGQICYGRWRAPDGEDVIVVRKAAVNERCPQVVEVHCHGGAIAVRAVLDALVERGCTEISWSRWIGLAERDPIRQDAFTALAHAPTERTAGVLLDQYHGTLSEVIERTRAALGRNEPTQALEHLESALRYAEVGLRLTRPWMVVLAGPPNVGKSSLINALVGFERAIVSPTPGTTRDVVTATTAIDGWPIELADTAGLRTTEDELEQEGVRRASDTMAAADLVINVRDVREGPPAEAQAIFRPATACLLVLNKIDLVASDDCTTPWETPADALCTSAVTGIGIEQLVEAIGRRLVPEAPPAGAAVPFLPRHVTALQAARHAITRGEIAQAERELLSLQTPSS